MGMYAVCIYGIMQMAPLEILISGTVNQVTSKAVWPVCILR
jgi:hypothetical protein